MRNTSLCLTLLALVAPASPAAEIRGAWVDRSSLVSREEIVRTVENLAAANFNTIHVNVWSRGYPLWHSERFRQETGILTDPGYGGRDVLREVTDEAQRNNLAVVAWVEYGFVGGWSGYFPGRSGKGPVFDTRPEWLAKKRDGSDAYPIAGGGGNFHWMVHTRPDVQEFLFGMMRELAAHYGLAAIEFDRARYPELDCGYDDYTRALYAERHDGAGPPENTRDAEWLRWRTDQINQFIARLYDAVHQANWRMLVTNASVPVPTGVPNYAQDYTAWVREKTVDFVSPQVYRRDAASFERDLDNQIRALPDVRRLVPGIDITNSNPEELAKMVEAVRSRQLPGVVIWYYRGLLNSGALVKLKETVFAEPADRPWN